MRLAEWLPKPAFILTDEFESSLLQQIASPSKTLYFLYHSALQKHIFDIRNKLQQHAEEQAVASESYFQYST